MSLLALSLLEPACLGLGASAPHKHDTHRAPVARHIESGLNAFSSKQGSKVEELMEEAAVSGMIPAHTPQEQEQQVPAPESPGEPEP